MRYWVYINGEVPGSYEPEELAAIPGFGDAALVCPASSDLAERRWERAGVFPDITEALRARPSAPLAPLEPPRPMRAEDPVRALSPDDVLNDSSQRIFRHVTELMKELENRREERALTQSLQRRVGELTGELNALRERATYLQGRADLIPGFQDREREMQQALARLRADLHETRSGAERLDADLAKSSNDLLLTRRHLEEAKLEAAEREKHLAALSKRLAEKEASLAKAFGVIRRLEESLGDLLPGVVAGISRQVPVQALAPLPAAGGPAAPAAEPLPAAEPAAAAPVPAAPAAEPAAPVAEPEPVTAPPDTALGEVEGAALLTLSDEPHLPTPEPPAAPAAPPPYTMDQAPSGGQRSLPPEGEVVPVPPPWQEKLGRLFSAFKRRLKPPSEPLE